MAPHTTNKKIKYQTYDHFIEPLLTFLMRKYIFSHVWYVFFFYFQDHIKKLWYSGVTIYFHHLCCFHCGFEILFYGNVWM